MEGRRCTRRVVALPPAKPGNSRLPGVSGAASSLTETELLDQFHRRSSHADVTRYRRFYAIDDPGTFFHVHFCGALEFWECDFRWSEESKRCFAPRA